MGEVGDYGPWLQEMRDGEDDAEENTDTADDDVGYAEEAVAAAHDGACRDHEGLGALVLLGGEVCGSWSAYWRTDRGNDTKINILSVTFTR